MRDQQTYVRLWGQIWPPACFCMAHEPRIVFTCLNEKKKIKDNILQYPKIIQNSSFIVHYESVIRTQLCLFTYVLRQAASML